MTIVNNTRAITGMIRVNEQANGTEVFDGTHWIAVSRIGGYDYDMLQKAVPKVSDITSGILTHTKNELNNSVSVTELSLRSEAVADALVEYALAAAKLQTIITLAQPDN